MLYFIVNPNAGGGKGYRVWRGLERRLALKKVESRVLITGSRGDAAAYASALTEDDSSAEKVIIGVGGDGTMNEIVDGLHISDRVRLGFIPVGRGSDLARGLRLPKTPGGCLKRILEPREIRPVDYGILSAGGGTPWHRRFIVSCGAGYDADVVRSKETEPARRRLRTGRRPSYVTAGIARLLKSQTVKGHVLLDGVKKVEFSHIFFVSAHIMPTEGGGFPFAPKAENADGELTLCIVNGATLKNRVGILLSSIRGNHLKYAGVRSYNCRELRVVLEEPVPIHADGEYMGMESEYELTCVRRKLRFIT